MHSRPSRVTNPPQETIQPLGGRALARAGLQPRSALAGRAAESWPPRAFASREEKKKGLSDGRSAPETELTTLRVLSGVGLPACPARVARLRRVGRPGGLPH